MISGSDQKLKIRHYQNQIWDFGSHYIQATESRSD